APIGIELIEPFTNNTNTSNTNTFNCFTYQYNLCIEDNFDDWEFVDRFINAYCLERGFGYQVYRNDKDPNDHTITRHKSFRCSLGGNYEARKGVNQNVHHLRNSNKTSCEWHCNFKLPKIEQQIRCTTLYLQHVFHKQDVYNVIYSLNKNTKDEGLDSGLLLNSLFEKMTEDLN
ncbi:hypothetical protein RhiirA5_424963, partial [Rhizophagus irregularis]